MIAAPRVIGAGPADQWACATRVGEAAEWHLRQACCISYPDRYYSDVEPTGLAELGGGETQHVGFG